MKQQLKCKWIFGLFTAALFASCSGFFELGSEEIKSLEDPNKPPTTFIQIDNTANRFPVHIYLDSTRKSEVVSVAGYQKSGIIEQKPTINNPRSFYITYDLPVGTGAQVPYIPKGIDGVISLLINKNETTPVVIKSLSTIINSSEPLFDNIWLAIKNNGNSVCRLSYYTSVFTPENLPNFDVNPGNTALYKFDSTADPSHIMINSDSPLPAEITAFEKGYLYEVEFNGTTAVLKSNKLLTLDSL